MLLQGVPIVRNLLIGCCAQRVGLPRLQAERFRLASIGELDFQMCFAWDAVRPYDG